MPLVKPAQILKFVVIVLLFGAIPNRVFAEPANAEKPLRVLAIDYRTVRLDSGETVELAGLDMTNLSNSETPVTIFSAAVTKHLQYYVSKEVMVEPETVSGPRKKVYLYFLSRATEIEVDPRDRPGEQPVLMIQSLKENQGKAQVQLATFKKIMINADLIKQGYARADRTGDYKYKGLFLEAEDYARNKKVGIWKEKPQQRVKT